MPVRLLLLVLLLLPAFGAAQAQHADAPTILLVTAHPDDDALFAGAVYKLTHDRGAKVDLALLTDGSGGFRYATLAEPIYGLDLTDEAVAREYLPAIRQQELMAGGRIVGLRKYFFLDQYDHAYTTDVDTVMQHVWDADAARERLRRIMAREDYDFVFTMLPSPQTHAHHSSAAILALQAAQTLPETARPTVLAGFIGSHEAPPTADPGGLPGYPVTRLHAELPSLTFDRLQPFGHDGRLNYQIVANWVIAAHKSQGTMQLLVNRGEVEHYWLYALNDPSRYAAAQRLFERLGSP